VNTSRDIKKMLLKKEKKRGGDGNGMRECKNVESKILGRDASHVGAGMSSIAHVNLILCTTFIVYIHKKGVIETI